MNKKIATAIILTAALAACSEKEPVVPVTNSTAAGTVIALPAVDWYIVDEQKMRDIYVNSGVPLEETSRLYGFAAVDPATGKNVIVTPPPKYVDDEVTCTVGHEMMHVAFGAYHEEVR